MHHIELLLLLGQSDKFVGLLLRICVGPSLGEVLDLPVEITNGPDEVSK